MHACTVFEQCSLAHGRGPQALMVIVGRKRAADAASTGGPFVDTHAGSGTAAGGVLGCRAHLLHNGTATSGCVHVIGQCAYVKAYLGCGQLLCVNHCLPNAYIQKYADVLPSAFAEM